jgi:hypothetical protein
LGLAVEVEAIAAQEVGHCLEFGVVVEVEAISAEGVGHCLAIGSDARWVDVVRASTGASTSRARRGGPRDAHHL